jgi:hypothetical protein
VKGSPPPAAVVVTPPIELLGADETVPVPPTELLVVSRLVVVSLEVVVPFIVVVVPLTVVVVAPEVLVAPLVVVPFTVVVVAPLVEVAPEVLVAPLVVVPLAVVVVAPEVVVAPDVVVAPAVVVVSLAVVVVSLAVVVVVPPVVVADASCPTLTPASTSRATVISQAAGRLDAFFTCLAIDPYLLLSALRTTLLIARHVQDESHPAISGQVGAGAKAHECAVWPRLLTGRFEAVAPPGGSDLSVGTWGIGSGKPLLVGGGPPHKTAGRTGRGHNSQAIPDQ